MKPITWHGWLAFVFLLFGAFYCLNPAAAEVLFKADFETGDFSQFGGKSKNIKPGDIEVVTDVVHSGKYAGRFTIHENNIFNAKQLRVQVNGPKVTVKEGADTFMSFYMYMKDAPKDRDNFFYWEGSPPPSYNNVMTWWVEPKKDGAGTFIKYGTGNLGRKGVHWEGDFTIGQWHQLGMHIHWSEDPAKGNAKLWWDGVVVLDKKVQTKGPQTVYFCQPGIHRDPHTKSVDTIYFDDFICATTLDEIEIQKPKTTDAKRAPEWIRPQGIDGTLVIGGGGTIPEAAVKRFLQAAGGDRAKLVIAVGNEGAPKDPSESILKKWKELKAPSVVILPARERNRADTETLTEAFSTATGVWIEDADAWKITQAFAGTTLETDLQRLLARGGAVGSSGDAASILTAVTTGAAGPAGQGFDLLPAAIIETHFREEKRLERLQEMLAKRSGRVGYGIDENTALIIRGRKIDVVGEGRVKVLLAAGNDRPAMSIALKSGDKHDLTALRRNAVARASEPYPPKVPRVPEVPSGTLVIVGGGGNPPDLTEKFIEFAGGPDALIVVLPTAGDPEIATNAGTAMFTKAGAKNVYALPSRLKKDVEDPKNLEILRKAGGVWFGGGRQWHFVDAYEGTKTYELFHDVLKRGGVIGGSSAGATIQGDYLSRGGVFNNFDIIYEGYERAFAFLPGVVIDQHFTQRKRQADMTKLMKTYPQLLGIGLDESTALIVRGHVADVTGKGTAHFYNYRMPPLGTVDFTPVRDGGRYDLKERRVIP